MVWLFLILVSSCNALQTEPEKQCHHFAEDAEWQDAIDCFEEGDYSETPESNLSHEEYQYLVQWSASYAGKYGLAGSSILDQILSGDVADFSTKANELLEAGQLLVSITETQRGISLLLNIPETIRNSQEETAAYYARDIETIGSLMTLLLVELQKAEFSTLGSEITPEELIAKADAILDTLANGGQVVSDPEIQDQIDEVLEEIENQPGETSAEKIESLIQSE